MLLQRLRVVIEAFNREVAWLKRVRVGDQDGLTSPQMWLPYRYLLLSIPYELLVILGMWLNQAASSAVRASRYGQSLSD